MAGRKANNTLPPDQRERDKITAELDGNMFVEAAAGTGKTTCLINRMLALLAAGKCSVREIAAVTFTRKAAAEMRARLQLELERELKKEGPDDGANVRRERLSRALDDISHLFVGTIHSFCGRLLRERPVEAGVDLGFVEIEERDDHLLAAHVWRETLEALRAADDANATTLRSLGVKLNDLKRGFLTFANYPDITDWGEREMTPLDIGALRKECEEYAKRVGALRSFFPPPEERGTDKLMNELEVFCDLVNDTSWADVRDVHAILNVPATVKPTQKYWRGEKKGRQDLLAKQEEARWNDFYAAVIGPSRTQLLKYRYQFVIKLYRVVAAELAARRRELGVLNFQDLLMKAAALLREHRAVREYFASKCKYLLVDEFQDTDPIQAEVLKLLTASNAGEKDWRKCCPRPGSLFVVGDPKQSIYRFRRADVATYNEVKSIILKGGGQLVQLTANFRAVQPLVSWVNNHFREVFPEKADDYAPAYVPLETGRTDMGEGDLRGLNAIRLPDDVARNQNESAVYDADVISAFVAAALTKGYTVPFPVRKGADPKAVPVQPGDFMVLTRVKQRLSLYADAFQRRRVPHAVTGSDALNALAELSIIKGAFAAAVYPEDPIKLVGFLRGEGWGASDEELYEFNKGGGRFCYKKKVPLDAEQGGAVIAEAVDRLHEYDRWLKHLPPIVAVERILEDLGLVAYAAAAVGGNGRAGGLLKALEILRGLHDREWSTAALADGLEALVATDDKELWQDAIPAKATVGGTLARVMNLHQAKGLEAAVVFLADPAGESDREPRVHIDRRGETPRGYIVVYDEPLKGTSGREKQIAVPPDWEHVVEEAREYEDAEKARLRYVAATRAGVMMVVTERANKKSPWYPLEKDLGEAKPLEVPEEKELPTAQPIAVKVEEVAAAREALAERRNNVIRASYERGAEKELALAAAARGGERPEGNRIWGNVIHGFLEAVVRRHDLDLLQMARWLLKSEGGDQSEASEAVAAVEGVMATPHWRRVRRAKRVLAEVPYLRKVSQPSRSPGVVAGVIDLAFMEGDGWVIVDYKTSAPPDGDYAPYVNYYGPQVRAYARAWEEITGERVKEVGLFFVGAEGLSPRYEVVTL
ncbi:MAG: UvrD-helicase domain-containing protein [Candidatus Zixiibacteriota bacterium]|jgi:ATP-dependent helicase/nuclease subunit A